MDKSTSSLSKVLVKEASDVHTSHNRWIKYSFSYVFMALRRELAGVPLLSLILLTLPDATAFSRSMMIGT